MQFGYKCEDCEVAVFPVTTRSELQWLRDRLHVVREVAKHSARRAGLVDDGGLRVPGRSPGT